MKSGRRVKLTTSPQSVSRLSRKCLSTLWASTASYRDGFTYFPLSSSVLIVHKYIISTDYILFYPAYGGVYYYLLNTVL
jgi:hypothetical protein